MANQLGISGAAASKLIPMLAPIIIGMLMKKGGGAAEGQAGAGGASGGLGGMAAILDRNGDGSILDDLSGLISKGGVGDLLATGGANKSGCLGAILGGLLGGKK